MPWYDSVSLASSAVAGLIMLAGDLAGTGSVAATPRVGTLTGVDQGATGYVVGVRDGAALGFVADEAITAIATIGDLRFRNNRTIVAGRNAANNGDIGLVSLNSTNTLILGADKDAGSQVTTAYLNASTTTALLVNATAVATATSTALTLNTGVALKLPGTVAASGEIRARHSTDVLVFRNVGGSDAKLISVDGTNNIFIGETGATPNVSGVYLNAVSTGICAISLGGTLRFRVNGSTDIQFRDVPLVFQNAGGTAGVASVGDIRSQNATTIVAARNAANLADITVLATNSSNIISIGSGATAVAVAVAGATPGNLGDLRFHTATARTLLGCDANAISADIAIISTDASDNLYFGTTSAGASQAVETLIAGSTSAALAGGADVIVKVQKSGAVSQLGFFNVTPSARASAYTQTYATTTKTVPTLAAYTPTNVADAWGFTTQAELNNVVADVATNRKLINAIIDDLQSYGLFQ